MLMIFYWTSWYILLLNIKWRFISTQQNATSWAYHFKVQSFVELKEKSEKSINNSVRTLFYHFFFLCKLLNKLPSFKYEFLVRSFSALPLATTRRTTTPSVMWSAFVVFSGIHHDGFHRTWQSKIDELRYPRLRRPKHHGASFGLLVVAAITNKITAALSLASTKALWERGAGRGRWPSSLLLNASISHHQIPLLCSPEKRGSKEQETWAWKTLL